MQDLTVFLHCSIATISFFLFFNFHKIYFMCKDDKMVSWGLCARLFVGLRCAVFVLNKDDQLLAVDLETLARCSDKECVF